VQALGIEGMDTSPGEADNISPQEIDEHLKRSLPKHPVVPVEEDLENPRDQSGRRPRLVRAKTNAHPPAGPRRRPPLGRIAVTTPHNNSATKI
jgi:hypothetical protein